MVGKFILASVSQNHKTPEVGRNLPDHLIYCQLQQGQLHVHSGFEHLHGDIHLDRLSHKIKQT